MKKTLLLAFGIFFLIHFCLPLSGFAEKTQEEEAEALSEEEAPIPEHQFSGTVTAAPVQYTFVEGDRNKYKELHWSDVGYEGGFEEFSLEEKHTPSEITATIDGHALIQNNDYEVNALIEKPNFGYLKFDFQEFSKYYDDAGGTYWPFRRFNTNTLGRELEMQIGHFRIETGITVEDYPHLMFAYERHYKDGIKSRLSWASVTEGATSRAIGPSFQYVDEIVDTIEFEQSHTIKGFEIKGRQAFEWSQAEMQREEASLSDQAAASGRKIRVQDQNTQYHLFTTTESAQRWFRDDTLLMGTAYNYLRIRNNELENIFEMNESRSLRNFTSPKQIRDARAENQYDSHTWTGNFMAIPLNWLNITTNLRTELTERGGESLYPSDTTPVAAGGSAPDGIINNIENSGTDDRVARIGESISFRITSIPRTAIYNDFEFEQLRNWLGEDRDSIGIQSVPNTGEIYGRETIAYMSRGIWTIGAQFYPLNWLNWTNHFRINRSNTDYEDKRETGATASGAKSAFLDSMNIVTNELASRVTFKLRPWLKPSARYQFQMRHYDTRAEDLAIARSHMDSHILTFDVTLQPLQNLLIVTGVSPQYAWVTTPAREIQPGHTPRFQANVISWLLNTTYMLNDRIELLSGLNYAHADNFHDDVLTGLPLGADFSQLDVTAGVNYKLSEALSLITEYGFMHYGGASQVDTRGFDAQSVSTRVKYSWG